MLSSFFNSGSVLIYQVLKHIVCFPKRWFDNSGGLYPKRASSRCYGRLTLVNKTQPPYYSCNRASHLQNSCPQLVAVSLFETLYDSRIVVRAVCRKLLGRLIVNPMKIQFCYKTNCFVFSLFGHLVQMEPVSPDFSLNFKLPIQFNHN